MQYDFHTSVVDVKYSLLIVIINNTLILIWQHMFITPTTRKKETDSRVMGLTGWSALPAE